jgi:hypothetical protein
VKGYILYRKDGETALVLQCQDDDELHYLLSKLHRTRNRWLKSFAGKLLQDFFEKSNSAEVAPPVQEVQSGS